MKAWMWDEQGSRAIGHLQHLGQTEDEN